MKMKNANFFQRHVEKLILGSALLVAAVIVLLYVVGEPHVADINGQTLGPTEVEQRVESLAQQLDANLKSPESGLPEMTVPPYTQDFAQRMDRRIADGPYSPTLARTGLDPHDVMPPQPPAPYDMPHPPVPTEVLAKADYGVLGELDTSTQQQALIKLIGDEQPQDFRSVSVSTTFDLGEWRDRLTSATALPNQFYRGMLSIAGVYLQRQTLDPATGEWGDTTIIKPLPTQISFLPSYSFDYTDEQAEQVISYIEDNQQQIARPEFPPLANGAIWLPPWLEVELSPADRREFQELGEDIDSITNRIERLKDRMERLGNAPKREQPRRAREVTRREPMVDQPGREPRRAQPPVQPRDQGSEMQQQLTRLEEELATKQARRDELMGLPADMVQNGQTPTNEAEYERFMERQAAQRQPNERFEPQPGVPQFMPGVQNPAEQQPNPQAARDKTKITVWAHDLTVEPGKTYRYRVLVSVLNPLFRQTRVEDSQRQKNFNKVALGPDTSEGGEVQSAPWSNPVRVDPEYYFFFVQGGQSPRVEVWHIYDGVWRSEEFTVQPGDPIGGEMKVEINGETRTIDMNVGAVVVDLMETAGGGGILGGNDARLLYLAPGSTQIATRSVQQDINSDARIRIQTERTIQQERARQASASRP